MDLNQIRFFLHLAETLSFTEAARRSGVSQPSLTKAIQRLEAELEAPLVHRDRRDTRLTALGRDILAEFMRIDRSICLVRSLAESSARGRSRSLNIGVGPTVTAGGFSGFFDVVLQQMPHLDLQVHPMLPGEDEAQLLCGKYDAVILPKMPPKSVKLASQVLYRERYRIGCASDHPLAVQEVIDPSQLPDELYVDRVLCEFHTEIVDYFSNREILMRPRFSSDREDWVQCFVAATHSICVLPERSVLVTGLVTRPVKGLDIERSIILVTLSAASTSPELKRLLQMASVFDWSTSHPSSLGRSPNPTSATTSSRDATKPSTGKRARRNRL